MGLREGISHAQNFQLGDNSVTCTKVRGYHKLSDIIYSYDNIFLYIFKDYVILFVHKFIFDRKS